RRSISQTASGAPLGSHHRATCSAFVQASKTTVRGASNARVMTISRADWVATVADLRSLIAAVWLSSFAPTVFLLLLQPTQVVVQTGEPLVPQASIRLQPLVDAPERCRDERAGTPLRIAPARNEARAFEHFEVLGDGRLAESERLHEFRHIRLT